MQENNWPIPVKVAPYKKLIRVDELSTTEKKLLSDHLKSKHPKKAKELYTFLNATEEDAFVQGLKALMGASLALEAAYLPACLKKYAK